MLVGDYESEKEFKEIIDEDIQNVWCAKFLKRYNKRVKNIWKIWCLS